MRAFPKNYKHLNIDLQWSNSKIGKFEDGSSKIWKIGRGIFENLENWKRDIPNLRIFEKFEKNK